MDYYFSDQTRRIKYVREAANVQRTHCSPSLRDHSVGKHSFNMVTMLLILWPEAPRHLIVACVKHDIPERTTGDMPHPAKKAGIQNNEAQEHAEQTINVGLFGSHEELHLSGEEQRWLSGLDMLEFYCYVKDEIMMGRKGYMTKLEAVEKYIENSKHLYPIEILDAYHRIKNDHWYDMPDAGGM